MWKLWIILKNYYKDRRNLCFFIKIINACNTCNFMWIFAYEFSNWNVVNITRRVCVCVHTIPEENGRQIHHPFHFEPREHRKEYLATQCEEIHNYSRFPESTYVQFRCKILKRERERERERETSYRKICKLNSVEVDPFFTKWIYLG